MKTLILSIAIFVLFSSLYCEQPDKRQRAANFYKRHIEIAHPLPQYEFKSSIPFILSAEAEMSNFDNVSTTVNETGQLQMQNESSIAVNPKNPKNLIASAVDYRDTSAAWVYISTNGGSTWLNKKLGRKWPGWRSSNDPSVAFDADGTGYVVYGGFGDVSDSLGHLLGENGVFLSKTTDEGLTWKAHNVVIVHRGPQTLDSTFEDKYYIWIDNSPQSPYFKHIYIPWKRVTARDSATQIVISKSADKGETWSVPVPVSLRLSNTSEDTTYGQSFPLAVTGPGGEVYVVWNHGIEHGVGYAKSTDGGATFSSPEIIQRYNIFGKTRYNDSQGWKHTVKGVVRAESYPTMVCDITNGSRRGYLYLCWAGDSIPNIYFSRSADGGNTWSQPVKVHKDIQTDHFWPWIAIDPQNGDLAVMYFDSRNDSANLLVDCYVSYSKDGGITWIDRRVSDLSGDLRRNPFGDNSFAGDYSGCAFFNGIIYPSWMDTRDAAINIFDSDVYTAIVNIRKPLPPQNFKANIIAAQPEELQLSWDIPTERSFGQKMDTSEFHYTLFRNNNYITALNASVTKFTDKGLTPYTEYEYSICTVSGLDTSVLAKIKSFPGGSKKPAKPEITGIYRNGERGVNIFVKVPVVRQDGVTPLVNLSEAIIYRDSAALQPVSLNISDTGKIITLTDQNSENGFYNYMVSVRDKSANESEKAGPEVIYSGKVDDTAKIVSQGKKLGRYLIKGNWALTDKFTLNEAYSLTDSPEGKYPNGRESYIVLFPIRNKTGFDCLRMSFWHAAILHQTDTAIVESSVDNMITWEPVKKYNKMDFPAWQDGILNRDDWKFESFQFNCQSNPDPDTIFIRLRLQSNVILNDDGWYLEGVKIVNDITSAEEGLAQNGHVIYPNPAYNLINLSFEAVTSKNVNSIRLFNIYGALISDSPEIIYSNEAIITFDISSLPQGCYFLSFKTAQSLIKFIPFTVVR